MKFLSTLFKSSHVVISIGITLFLALSACNNYNKLSLSNTDFKKQKHIQEETERYDIYLHSGEKAVKLSNAKVDEHKIRGGISSENIAQSSDAAFKDVDEELKNDVHIYLKDGNSWDESKGEIEIETADIDSAELYAKEGEGLTGLAIAAIIVGAFLVALLIIGLIAAAVNSSDEDNSSSDSNSNSNSNSGDSGSGASSDGSNSSSDGSGCYVATMVYGSYEAPKVLILRAFRDQFLQRFKWGRSFIHWYYAKSPAFVEQHQGKPLLHKAIKSALDVFVFLITPIYRK